MSNRLPTVLLALTLSVSAPLALAMDRDQAAALAQQSTGGRVLSVERSDQDGRPVFRVRVLTPSGEVRVVVVDGATGRVR